MKDDNSPIIDEGDKNGTHYRLRESGRLELQAKVGGMIIVDPKPTLAARATEGIRRLLVKTSGKADSAQLGS